MGLVVLEVSGEYIEWIGNHKQKGFFGLGMAAL